MGVSMVPYWSTYWFTQADGDAADSPTMFNTAPDGSGDYGTPAPGDAVDLYGHVLTDDHGTFTCISYGFIGIFNTAPTYASLEIAYGPVSGQACIICEEGTNVTFTDAQDYCMIIARNGAGVTLGQNCGPLYLVALDGAYIDAANPYLILDQSWVEARGGLINTSWSGGANGVIVALAGTPDPPDNPMGRVGEVCIVNGNFEGYARVGRGGILQKSGTYANFTGFCVTESGGDSSGADPYYNPNYLPMDQNIQSFSYVQGSNIGVPPLVYAVDNYPDPAHVSAAQQGWGPDGTMRGSECGDTGGLGI